jgi:hypothetical protein
MAWSFPPQSFFVARGESAEFWFSPGGGTWVGPQFAEARVDASSGGSGDRKLFLQYHGPWNHSISLGVTHEDYIVGVFNPSDSDIWFHFEGGGVT